MYGAFARSQGAIGSDGRFAVFPDRATGYRAMGGLVFNGKYADLSLKDAIARYAPPHENNSLAYARAVASKVGVSLATKMRDVPMELRGVLTQAMAGVEGLGRAVVKDLKGNIVGHINPRNEAPQPAGGALPDAPRFQTIAARTVAPTPQSIRTAATLGALPAGGSTRLPDRAYAAPVSPVTRSPLAAIASAINPISSAQAAPMPNRPSVSAAMGLGTVTPPSFASARMMAPAPSVPAQSFSQPSAPANLSRQQISAYRDYGNTRAYAPVDPVPSRPVAQPPRDGFLTSALPVGQAQPLQQSAQPTFVPTTQPVNPVALPVAPTVPQYIAKPVQQRIDEAFTAPAPAPAPRMPTAMDVYSGQANRGMASDGSMVSRDQYGRTSISNGFGATTITNPDGHQMAARGGGISGPIGDPGIRTPDMPSVPQRPSQLGGMVRGGIGSVVGGGLGGMLAGPLGAALGAVVASDLARGRNPIDRLGIGTFTVPVRDQFGFTQQMRFANPKSGGAFPDAPRNPAGGLGGKDSNRSERAMRDISPAAARDIKSGKSGLF